MKLFSKTVRVPGIETIDLVDQSVSFNYLMGKTRSKLHVLSFVLINLCSINSSKGKFPTYIVSFHIIISLFNYIGLIIIVRNKNNNITIIMNEYCWIKLNLDFNYTFTINLKSNVILRIEGFALTERKHPFVFNMLFLISVHVKN